MNVNQVKTMALNKLLMQQGLNLTIAMGSNLQQEVKKARENNSFSTLGS